MERHFRQADEYTVADGILNPDLLIRIQMAQGQQHDETRIQMAQGQQHDETQGAFIHPAAFLMLQCQRNQRAVRADRLVKFAHNTAGQSGKRTDREIVQLCQARLYGRPVGKLFLVVNGSD